MPSLAPHSPPPARLPPWPLYHFSADQFRRMAAAGILNGEPPVELREGLIVLKSDSSHLPALAASLPTGNGIQVAPSSLRRFTVDEYDRMVQAGILSEDDPVELLEGWVVQKMPRNPPHDAVLYRSHKEVSRRLPGEWICRGQSGTVTSDSKPEPDLAVVRGPEERYYERHPAPEDIGAAMEVADSTLQGDRDYQGPIYARANIPAYWIINIPEAQVEVYTDPSGASPSPGYRQRQDYGTADTVPLVLDGREAARIAVKDLLLPRTGK